MKSTEESIEIQSSLQETNIIEHHRGIYFPMLIIGELFFGEVIKKNLVKFTDESVELQCF